MAPQGKHPTGGKDCDSSLTATAGLKKPQPGTGLNGDLAILDAKLKADEALALVGGRTAVDEPAGP